MVTYKQPIKEMSRALIWGHAIESLTSKRYINRILDPSYMEYLWLYCQQQLDEHLDIETFVQWKKYSDICYGEKSPKDLKVAFFCGNEPENDVNHLLRLGVRIENIYAFECDSKAFKQAVDSLHNTFPLLKIFKGKIENFAELQNTKFDVVYLDFTGSLIKEYKTVVQLLDLNAFSDMSILAVNTTYPDKTEKNLQFLTNFFFHDTFFEFSVIDGDEATDEDKCVRRAEDCICYGLDYKSLNRLINTNFDNAYSAFQTAFLLDYANRHKASYEVFKQSMLSNRIIDSSNLNNINKLIIDCNNVLVEETILRGNRLASNQYLKDGFIEIKEKGTKLSRHDCMKLSEILLASPYRHLKIDYFNNGTFAINENKKNLKSILTREVQDVINNIECWFHGGRAFCDNPMEHLWLELLINQYGHPYHTNVNNHRRFCYTAKSRKMCVDVLTLDKCRALYDWIPMLEYFIHDMANIDRQMITRMCMDAINKQLLHIVDEVFRGASLVGVNEFIWSRNKEIENRDELFIK